MDIEYLIAAAAYRLGPQLKDPPSAARKCVSVWSSPTSFDVISEKHILTFTYLLRRVGVRI
jgi:hypothetical protein